MNALLANHPSLKRRIQDARELLREVERADRPLARLLSGAPPLQFLGSGVSSIVFGIGKDKVLRVTPGSDLVDCEIPELLLARRPKGWPKVHHVVMVEAEDGTACIIVADRVTPWSKLSKQHQDDLEDAATLVSMAHFRYAVQSKKEKIEKTPEWDELSSRAKVWARQLWKGLVEVGRLRDATELDTIGDNFGLNSRDEAVWLDYGI